MTIITYPSSAFVEVRRNLALNPRMVSSGAGYTLNQGGTGGDATIQFLTGTPPMGSTYLALTRTVAPSSGFSYMRVRQTTAITAVAGRSYTFSAWVQSTSEQTEVLYMIFRGSGYENLGEYRNEDDIPRNTWKRVALTVTAPAGTVSVEIFAGLLSSVVGDTFRTTGWLVEESKTMGAYFDGATPSTPIQQRSWTGTANNSASVEKEPVAADRVDPVMILGPWRVSRDTRRVRHLLLDSGEYLYTFKPATLGGGVLELLFTSYAAAVSAVGKFSRDVFWQLYEQIGTDPTPVDMLFAVDEGELEIEQSGDSGAPFLVRVPWKEL